MLFKLIPRTLFSVLFSGLLLLGGCTPKVGELPGARASSLKPEEVPEFAVYARVLSAGKDDKPLAEKKFSFQWALNPPGTLAKSQGAAWSELLKFERPQIEAVLKGYPAQYIKRWPVVVRLQVNGVQDPTVIEGQLKFAESEEVIPFRGELFGPRLGFLIWRDEKNVPHAATMAEYNRRYWRAIEDVALSAEERPRLFPIVDRFIGGDDDRIDWREGIDNLSKAGFSAIMLPGSAPIRELLLETGRKRTAGAIYAPPGYAFDFRKPDKNGNTEVSEQEIEAWAQKQAEPFLKAGYAPQDMAIYAMSDEPGWYYPTTMQTLTGAPAALARFRNYLKDQGLSPQDVGATSWEGVLPIGRSAVQDLPSRRLFYWTMRFFPWDSARHFANATRALEKAFYPGMPIFTNWNFFSGRSYVPGPIANNPNKQSLDAAMGGHDWFEFGRMRGGTMLWTEDWFGDGQAYQWSFYMAKLASAARKSGVQFGGYIVPRTSNTADGMLQKVLSIVGNGGKAIKYFVFGPEYNFPTNCYSENPSLLRNMAAAHRVVGAAEDLLWPGQRQQAQVAILQPRSSEVWDANGISDATNTNLNRATVDYVAEVFDLYWGLQQQNIPADFVSEEDLAPAGLKGYKVLYVTEPNFPREWVPGLVQWVRDGGVLVSVSGAFTADRYDDPMTDFQDARGIVEAQRPRLMVSNVFTPNFKADGAIGQWGIFGKGAITAPEGSVLARFNDDTPAIVERNYGKGKFIHYAFLLGISVMRSSSIKDEPARTYSSPEALRWVAFPTREAAVEPPVTVDQLNVETPLLLSAKGAAITLLNWRKEDVARLNITAHVPFAVKSVEAVRAGKIAFTQKDDAVSFVLPLGAADVVTLRPR
jgi:hypothetical protein